MFPGHRWCGHGGPSTGPKCVRSCEPGLPAVGGARGLPRRGGALRRCEGRLRSGACPPPAARHRGGLLGPATRVPWARACGRGGLALSSWLACPAGGRVPRGLREVLPGAGWLGSTVVRGVCCQALSLSRLPVSGGGQPGPVACWSGARLVWVWGPSTGPTARALASRCCPLWGWREHVPGEGALRRCEGRLRFGARPPSAARPQGGLLRSATPLLWARECGRGGPALFLWLACPAGGCLPRGWWGAVPWGGGLPTL